MGMAQRPPLFTYWCCTRHVELGIEGRIAVKDDRDVIDGEVGDGVAADRDIEHEGSEDEYEEVDRG